MKHWHETQQVVHALSAWLAEDVACALATVVRVQGSAYRHEGAKLAVNARGEHVGNVSGGCLEADVREVALRVATSGVAERRRYCGGSDEVAAWDLGLGCEGVVDLLVEPVREPRTADALSLALGRGYVAATRLEGDAEGPLGLATPSRVVLRPHGAEARRIVQGTLGDAALDAVAAREAAAWYASGRSGIVVHGDATLFVEVLVPAPQFVVVGAGDDAVPVAALAAATGFRTTVVDRRPALLARERFEGAVRLVEGDADALATLLADARRPLGTLGAGDFAVVMTHDFAHDAAYLRALLASPVGYVGALGPRARTERMLAAFAREGVVVDESRLYAPVGLDIGTDGAEQVAIAIVAEALAVRSGRRPRSLRERATPIHAAE